MNSHKQKRTKKLNQNRVRKRTLHQDDIILNSKEFPKFKKVSFNITIYICPCQNQKACCWHGLVIPSWTITSNIKISSSQKKTVAAQRVMYVLPSVVQIRSYRVPNVISVRYQTITIYLELCSMELDIMLSIDWQILIRHLTIHLLKKLLLFYSNVKINIILKITSDIGIIRARAHLLPVLT